MKNTARYTITAIAKELDVTRQTIYYWIKKGWIMPGRDYRNYPVFSDKDLSCIKKWHGTLTKETTPVKHAGGIKTPISAASIIAPLTWEEIQKALYKT